MASTVFDAVEDVVIADAEKEMEEKDDGFITVARQRTKKPVKAEVKDISNVSTVDAHLARFKNLSGWLQRKTLASLRNWHLRYDASDSATHRVNLFRYASVDTDAPACEKHFAGIQDETFLKVSPANKDQTVPFQHLFEGIPQPKNWDQKKQWDGFRFLRNSSEKKIDVVLEELVAQANKPLSLSRKTVKKASSSNPFSVLDDERSVSISSEKQKADNYVRLEPYSASRYDDRGEYIPVFPKGTRVKLVKEMRTFYLMKDKKEVPVEYMTYSLVLDLPDRV